VGVVIQGSEEFDQSLELEGNSEGLGSEQEEQGSEREENNEGSGSE
jgi:hypothetical protein